MAKTACQTTEGVRWTMTMLRNLSSDDLKLYALSLSIAFGVLAIVGFIVPFLGDPNWGPSHPPCYVKHEQPRRRVQYHNPAQIIYNQPWADYLSNNAQICSAVAFVSSIAAFILYGRARRREEIG